MNCETCAERKKQAEPVPFIAYESAMARLERTIKRLWILLMVMLVLLVGSNVAWIVCESQFVDEVTETIETSAEGGGNAYGTIISGDGSEVNYGESEGNSN